MPIVFRRPRRRPLPARLGSQFPTIQLSAVTSGDRRLRASMANELRSAEFPQRLRGYDRAAVDRAVKDLLRELS